MRTIFISSNRILHEQWKKSFTNNEINHLYNKEEIEKFSFNNTDLVLFDFDNLHSNINTLLKTNLICLSSKLDETKGFLLLKKGVKAYGNNYMAPFNLKEVIKIVKSGKVWIYPELMTFILENTSLKEKKINVNIENLSVRELTVAKLVAKGFSNKEISKELDIKERTVKAHVSSSFAKLEIKDRVQLGLTIKDYYNL